MPSIGSFFRRILRASAGGLMFPLRYATFFVLSRRAQRTSFDGISLLNWEHKSDHSALLSKVADTLRLIQERDPRRYARLREDVPQITLTKLQTAGVFVPHLGGVFLDLVYVRDVTVYQLSLAVVHEATHARLHRAGIRINSGNRERHERICLDAEVDFAVQLGYDAETLGRSNEPYWDDEVRFARVLNELREGGLPDWYVRVYQVLFRP